MISIFTEAPPAGGRPGLAPPDRAISAAREITTSRLVLDAGGESRYESKDEETVIVLQQGKGTFKAGGQNWPVSRSDVFKERATALYVPPGVAVTVNVLPRLGQT